MGEKREKDAQEEQEARRKRGGRRRCKLTGEKGKYAEEQR